MKLKIASAACLGAALLLSSVGTAQAQTNTNLFPVFFRAVCVSTNAGGLDRDSVTSADLIQDCADDHGLTNTTGLRLVFNRTNFSLQVVGTNQVAVCTPFTFAGGLSFTNTNHTIFQHYVYVDTNLVASGVLVGTAHWNPTNQYGSFGLSAKLFYTEAASGTNSAEICRAVLRVGSDLGVRHDDDDDDDDDDDGDGNGHGHGHGNGNGQNGNNGNHYGWDQPKNPHSRK